MHNNYFKINDIELAVSPSNIRVDKSTKNIKIPIVRESEAVKNRSGHGDINVSFDVIFSYNENITSSSKHNDIKNDLLKIVAQLQLTPFFIVENEFVTKSIKPEYQDSEPLMLVLNNMSISTSPELHNSIIAQFNCFYVEHSAFTPFLFFKRTETSGADEKPVKISESGAWKAFYKPYWDRLRSMAPSSFNGSCHFLFPVLINEDGNVTFGTTGFDIDGTQVPVSVTVNFYNRLAVMPFIGLEYPAYQYMGGSDREVFITIEDVSGRDQKFKDLLKLLQHFNQLAINDRQTAGNDAIVVKNDILNMLGIEEVICESVSVETHPSEPETSIINLHLLSHNIDKVKEAESLEREEYNTVESLVEEIIDNFINYTDASIVRRKVTDSVYDDTFLLNYDFERSVFVMTSGIPDLPAPLDSLFEDFKKTLSNIYSGSIVYKLRDDFYDFMNHVDDAVFGIKTKLGVGPSIYKNKDNEANSAARRVLTDFAFKAFHVLKDYPDAYPEMKIIAEKVDYELKHGMRKNVQPCYPDIVPDDINKNPDDYFFYSGSLKEIIKEAKLFGADAISKTFDAVEDFTDKNGIHWDFSGLSSGDKASINNIKSSLSGDGVTITDGRPAEFISKHKNQGRFTKTSIVDKELFLDGYNDTSMSLKAEMNATHRFDKASFKSQFELIDFPDDFMTFRKAYPTFRLYFIEEYSQKTRMRKLDDKFVYRAIKEIRVIRSRKNPIDTAIIQLSNVDGSFYIRNFKRNDLKGTYAKELVRGKYDYRGHDVYSSDNKKDNLLDEKPIFQEGSVIQIRLGYDNNPDKLTTVLNGKITEIDGDGFGIITIVVQSFGYELLEDTWGTPGDGMSLGGWFNNTTPSIITEILSSPSITHFGRWTYGYTKEVDPDEIERKARHSMLPNFIVRHIYRWIDTPKDDNIFAPYESFYRKYIEDFAILRGWKDYYSYGYTTWDILKDMERRWPGYVCQPVPYENRMTLFFGIPSMGYWFRDDSYIDKMERESTLASLQRKYKSIRSSIEAADSFSKKGIHGVSEEAYKIADRVIRKVGRWKSFRDYHMLTSEHDILSNGVKTSSKNTYNGVRIIYDNDFWREEEFDINNLQSEFTLKPNKHIPDEEITYQDFFEANVIGDDGARVCAISRLLDGLRDLYTGEIALIGNPRIKPYDICFIYDSYNDIAGPVEVEQVVHIFNQEDGFITLLTPDLCAYATEYASSTFISGVGTTFMKVWDKLANATDKLIDKYKTAIVNDDTFLKTGMIGVGAFTGDRVIQTSLAAMFTPSSMAILSIGSLFMLNVLYDWDVGRYPIQVFPLLFKDKPYILGLPDWSETSLWQDISGEWKFLTSGVKKFWESEIKEPSKQFGAFNILSERFKRFLGEMFLGN